MADWTLDELAEITGTTKRTVATWRKEAMPIIPDKKRGRALLVDSREFFEWWTDRNKAKVAKGLDPESAEYWTKRKRQIEVEEMEKRLIDRDKYVAEWNSQIAKVRKMVLSIPNRCASLVAMQPENKARVTLSDEVNLILRECVEKET